MKKFLVGIAAVAMLMATSCKNENATVDAQQALYNDSISVAYGEFVGSVIANQSTWTPEQKQQFMQAFSMVLTSCDSLAAQHGATVATQMLQEKQQFQSYHVDLNYTLVVNSFRKTFFNDTISTMEVTRLSRDFQRMFTDARMRAAELDRRKRAESAEAQQNVINANNFITNLRNEQPNLQETESGLYYVIEEPGTGNHPDANSTVRVKYNGKHLNGNSFDTNANATFNLQGVVAGFREGLMLLGKGGKATLYIPANLAYGSEGTPDGSIQPNEMIIFDVELLDINE